LFRVQLATPTNDEENAMGEVSEGRHSTTSS
jgi:hypothetical protein